MGKPTRNFSNARVHSTTRSYASRAVSVLFAGAFLVSVAALTLTTITSGWSFVVCYVIAATAPCLPGLIVLGCVGLQTTSTSPRTNSKEMSSGR
jgi:hypothetical protein